jgi:hypothetical protein
VRHPVRWVVKGVGVLTVVTIVFALLGLVVMLLWNALVPALFRGPVLQYWQAVALLLLSRVLFGGLRGRGGWHGHWRRHMWRERWEQLTPEERAQLRERFMRHCGHGDGPPESAPSQT